jgi:hypothetical protein
VKALTADMVLDSRHRRRDAIKLFIECLSSIRNAEQKCLDNTPENFQYSESFESGEIAVDTFNEIIDMLSVIY